MKYNPTIGLEVHPALKEIVLSRLIAGKRNRYFFSDGASALYV
ncbi:MAG: hypothetical protein Q8P76_04275 [bacterium]|nr:hypothetical protein [bacterium]